MKTMDKSIEPFIFAHATKKDNAKLIVFFLMKISFILSFCFTLFDYPDYPQQLKHRPWHMKNTAAGPLPCGYVGTGADHRRLPGWRHRRPWETSGRMGRKFYGKIRCDNH